MPWLRYRRKLSAKQKTLRWQRLPNATNQTLLYWPNCKSVWLNRKRLWIKPAQKNVLPLRQTIGLPNKKPTTNVKIV